MRFGVQRFTWEFGAWGSGFGVWGLGFRVQGLGFRIWGSACKFIGTHSRSGFMSYGRAFHSLPTYLTESVYKFVSRGSLRVEG